MNPYIHKVDFYETDQMGVVHHSNYIRWFETARIDALDQAGLTYAKMEEDGHYLPYKHKCCISFQSSIDQIKRVRKTVP